MATKFEPLVTLDELGIAFMTTAEMDAWQAVAGVEVKLDYLDRQCITLGDAYRLAEERREATRQYREAESKRNVEHQAAVEELREALSAAFIEARDAALRRLGGRREFEPGETNAQAVNEGLEAARSRWLAAPAEVAREVYQLSVEVRPPASDGSGAEYQSVDLNTIYPRGFVDQWIRQIARNS